MQADYWQALFIDGKCVEQHHEIDLTEYLRRHGVDIEKRYAYNDSQVEQLGGFPDDLRKIRYDD